MTLAPRELLDWVRLLRTEGVGPMLFKQLLARYGSAADALKHLPELAARGGRRRALEATGAARAEQELAKAAKAGVAYIAVTDPGYPPLLAEIEDAPPLLLVRGDAAVLARPAIAVVGARNATINGRKFANMIARDLAAAGYLVVSGLARGIDGAAHEGALAAGTTAAVLAGGIDVIYPPEHRELHGRIAAAGALVSEMPLGTEPLAAYFPRRNRIISGLSLGVVVVEATEKSGSLITARLAADQSREVFAVPGSPLDPRARGPNGLIRDGATLVQGADDVLAVLGSPGRSSQKNSPRPFISKQPIEISTEIDLDPVRRQISAALGSTPVSVDELGRQCHVTAPVLAAVLLELELAGRLERLPGNRVVLVGTS